MRSEGQGSASDTIARECAKCRRGGGCAARRGGRDRCEGTAKRAARASGAAGVESSAGSGRWASDCIGGAGGVARGSGGTAGSGGVWASICQDWVGGLPHGEQLACAVGPRNSRATAG